MASTTELRTYRYLRLTLVGTVVVIFVAIAIVTAVFLAWEPLPSISHYYYTPARTSFTGALIAAAAALIALSGIGIRRTLLRIAALIAPLIAIVPTPFDDDDIPATAFEDPGTLVGTTDPLSVFASVPADIFVGVWTWLGLAVTGVIVSYVVVARSNFPDKGRRSAYWLLHICSGAVALVLLVWIANPNAVVDLAHMLAAGTFFVLIAAFAAKSDKLLTGQDRRTRAKEWRQRLRQRISRPDAGALLALALILDLAYGAVVVAREISGHDVGKQVLYVEVVALVLFALIWVRETHQYWAKPI